MKATSKQTLLRVQLDTRRIGFRVGCGYVYFVYSDSCLWFHYYCIIRFILPKMFSGVQLKIHNILINVS